MATYVVGDIQGCYLTFQKLLQKIQFDFQKDKLILLGDVINRGPQSLETLRFIKEHSSSMEMILGNHEIFAIALALDAIKENRSHTLKSILSAKDKDELIDFLRKKPLIITQGNNVFVHAGILPSRTVFDAVEKAQEISTILQGPKAKKFLERFYEKTPTTDRPSLTPKKVLRLSLAYLTLVRMCDSPISMDLNYNGTLEKAPKRLKPWFMLREEDHNWIFYFGHWAALGLYHHGHYHCLDSGCAWGNKLSAMRLSDHQVFQVENSEKSKG